MSDSAARPGRPGKAIILAAFMETATNTRPVNVAAAPASTASKVLHSAIGGVKEQAYS